MSERQTRDVPAKDTAGTRSAATASPRYPRCEKAMTPWDLANEPQGVISPNGLCGMNATGPDWWWPC